MSRIVHFKFVPHDLLSSGAVSRGELFPIQLRQIPRQVMAFGLLRFQSEQIRHGLVEINDPSLLVHHKHAVFNRVEQRFQKTPLARQPLNDGLQTFGIEPANAPEHLVEKAGFGCHRLTR